jgi:hypothetical protein
MAVTAEREKHGVGGAWVGNVEGAKEQRSKDGKEGKSIWHMGEGRGRQHRSLLFYRVSILTLGLLAVQNTTYTTT